MGKQAPGQLEISRPIDAYRTLREQWATDPVLYARQRLGMTPTWQQRQILEAIAPDGAKVTVRSGHGVGKTGGIAGALWWFLETRDFPKIPCTAPTAHQLHDVLWAEARKWQRKSRAASDLWDCPEYLRLDQLFRITRERIYTPDAREEWFAVARTSGKDNPDALQGFHATDLEIDPTGQEAVEHGDESGRIMFLIEEASGIIEEVFEVAEGALSSPGARLLMAGNPVRTRGYFAESHRANRSTFTALHFRTQDSPLADPDYRDQLVRKWGEGSNIVRVRADGEFPRQEDDVLIPLENPEGAIQRPAYQLGPGLQRRMGVDVARYGDDRVALTLRVGPNTVQIRVTARQSTMETAGQVRNAAREWYADLIFIDVIGIGAGVVDRLLEFPDIQDRVVPVNAAESAPPRGEGDLAQGKTMRDYLWLEGARYLAEEAPSFAQAATQEPELVQDLAGELASTKYSNDSSGRIVIESKDAMKKRGLPSPDLADSWLLTHAPHRPASEEVASAGRRRYR